MAINEADQSFEIRRLDGREYMDIQWRAKAEYTGMELLWHFYVHRTGTFPDDNFDNLEDVTVMTQKLSGYLRYDAMESRRGGLIMD